MDKGLKPVCCLVSKRKGEMKKEEDLFDVAYHSVDRLTVIFISTPVSLINVCMLSVLNFMNE